LPPPACAKATPDIATNADTSNVFEYLIEISLSEWAAFAACSARLSYPCCRSIRASTLPLEPDTGTHAVGERRSKGYAARRIHDRAECRNWLRRTLSVLLVDTDEIISNASASFTCRMDASLDSVF